MAKAKTVKAETLQSGALFRDGVVVQFAEGQEIDWPADDAPRAEANNVIRIKK